MADRTDDQLAALTLAEKVGLLSGDGPLVAGTREMAVRYNARPIVAASVPRLGIDGIRFTDGPRGVVMGASTAFPSSMARGATFDPELEERIGDVIGVEARAQGANLFAGVCINVLRHPAWGRAQETYGEDGHLLGEMGAALVRGTQRHVMACIKHYAANNQENSRLWLDVEVDEADLRDLYLPHFKRCVDEGAAAVMTAYNGVNGAPCGHNRRLITDILKGEWGFEGFVMSDFTWGVRSARAAVLAGMDLEMPFGAFFKRLPSLVRRGRVPVARIDDAARRLLSTQARFADRGEPERYRLDDVAGPEHRALAREAARRSLVLLRNHDVLPLDGGVPVRSLAVIGELAAQPNLGDLGSSQVHPPSVVTVLQGLQAAAALRGIDVRHHDGREVEVAAALAASCDAAIVVAGSTWRDEGEWIVKAGGDRSSLRLRAADEALLRAIGQANPRTAAVLMGGSAFITDAWRDQVGAVLMAWYPGMEGGHAVADVVFGDHAPEGRLPCTWPAQADELPPFTRFARRVRYGPLFGYRLMEARQQQPAFWFGHGLGYGTVTWGQPEVRAVHQGVDGARRISVAVELTNAHHRPAVEVVQAYLPLVLGTHPQPLNTLRGFTRVALEAGEARTVVVEVEVPPRVEVVRVGPSADPTALVELQVPGPQPV